VSRTLACLGTLILAVASCAKASPGKPEADAAIVVDMPTVDMPIDAAFCITQPCDLHAQCGCNATQTCDIDFNDLMGNACRGITTPGRETDTCTNVAACDRGYVCVGGASDSSCQRYCQTDTDCDGPRGQCAIQLVNGMTPIPGAVTCSSNYDPVAATNTACPATWSCDVFTVTNGGVTKPNADCRQAGTAAQKATRSANVARAPGLPLLPLGAPGK